MIRYNLYRNIFITKDSKANQQTNKQGKQGNIACHFRLFLHCRTVTRHTYCNNANPLAIAGSVFTFDGPPTDPFDGEGRGGVRCCKDRFESVSLVEYLLKTTGRQSWRRYFLLVNSMQRREASMKLRCTCHWYELKWPRGIRPRYFHFFEEIKLIPWESFLGEISVRGIFDKVLGSQVHVCNFGVVVIDSVVRRLKPNMRTLFKLMCSGICLDFQGRRTLYPLCFRTRCFTII